MRVPGTALQERLVSLRVRPDPDTEREIRRLVWAYVDDRKAAGWPVERVLMAIKHMARAAGIKPSTRVIKDERITSTDVLLVEMVGWCIHRYYRPQQSSDKHR
jgi:hypothetical protein